MGFPRRNGACPSLRRALLGLAAATVAMPAALVTAMPAAAALPIGLISSSSWSETLPGNLTAIHIVGQLQNNTAGIVSLVRVNVNLADARANDMAWTYATVDVLGPNESSPFELVLVPAPAGYTGYTIGAISYANAASQPYHVQLAPSMDPCPAGYSADWVCGRVTNNGAVRVDSVRAVITYLDASNTTVATEHPVAENARMGTTLAPGETGHFAFQLALGEPIGTHAVVIAEPGYPADLNPNPFDLGHVNVGKSAQQDVTLFNKGPLPITVSGAQAMPAAEFAATATDCPNTGLPAGQSCHISVRFTPAARGARSGTLTITDDAAGSPQTVVLTGTGAAPQVAFLPASGLDFGDTVRAGTPGMFKNVALLNTGDGPLTITSMTSDDPNDFKVDGIGCPSAPYTVAPGGQCLIAVTFVPSIAGPYGMTVPHTNLAAANLVVVDDAGTQKLPLSGVAAGPGAQFSSGPVTIAGVDFGRQAVNAASPPMAVTLTNNGSEPLTISNLAVTGDFSETDTCGLLQALAAGASCTVSIVFTPSQAVSSSGRLTITDNAGNGQQSIMLAGLGVNVSGRRQGSGVHREVLIAPIVAIPVQPTIGATNVTIGSGHLVTFTVTGATPKVGTATANASGKATFTYTRTNTGNDTVVATTNVSEQLVTSNSAKVTWTAALPPAAPVVLPATNGGDTSMPLGLALMLGVPLLALGGVFLRRPRS